MILDKVSVRSHAASRMPKDFSVFLRSLAHLDTIVLTLDSAHAGGWTSFPVEWKGKNQHKNQPMRGYLPTNNGH